VGKEKKARRGPGQKGEGPAFLNRLVWEEKIQERRKKEGAGGGGGPSTISAWSSVKGGKGKREKEKKKGRGERTNTNDGRQPSSNGRKEKGRRGGEKERKERKERSAVAEVPLISEKGGKGEKNPLLSPQKGEQRRRVRKRKGKEKTLSSHYITYLLTTFIGSKRGGKKKKETVRPVITLFVQRGKRGEDRRNAFIPPQESKGKRGKQKKEGGEKGEKKMGPLSIIRGRKIRRKEEKGRKGQPPPTSRVGRNLKGRERFRPGDLKKKEKKKTVPSPFTG